MLFWPVGDQNLETASADAKAALSNLAETSLDITPIAVMTCRKPTDIPRLAKSVNGRDFDCLVLFSATYLTALCIIAIVKRFKVPAIVWALPRRYALASSGLAASYLRERGYWLRLLCAEPDDRGVKAEIETIARVSHALRQSKATRIGLVGKPSPLMVSLPYDLELLQRRLGPKTIEISMQSLDRALKSVKPEAVESAVLEFKQKFDVKVQDAMLAKTVRFQLAVKEIVSRNRIDAIALECWTNLFSKYGVNSCLGHLNDLTVGCEGDVVSLSGSIILRGINGINPYLTDILAVEEKTNTIRLCHCSAPISLAKDSAQVSLVELTDPRKAGKTVVAHFDFKNGPVTLVRFYGRRLDKMHMTWGELGATGQYWGGISLEVHSNVNAKNFMNNLCGNHYLLTYGDIRRELRLFAEWNDLEVLED